MSRTPMRETPVRSIPVRPLAGATGAVAVASLAAGIAWSALGHWSCFQLADVEVRGVERLAATDVVRLAGLERPRPLVQLDPDLIAERLERSGWISEARVTRAWPDGIRIDVRERAPRALVHADQLYAVDDQGNVFKRAEVADRFDLPVVTGIPLSSGPEAASARLSLAVSLLDALESRFAMASGVDELHRDPTGRWSVVLGEGREVVLGDAAGLAGAIDRYERLAPVLGNEPGTVLRVDVSDPNDAYVRFATHGSGAASGYAGIPDGEGARA